jgi:hypothetical protein
MRVCLISTYELGHQPFGMASPAAWLAATGAEVSCFDLSREELKEEPVREADLIAFYVPMHTATRLAIALLDRVKLLNPRAQICFYGLYAPVNEAHLRSLGAETILGGEFEEGLVSLVERLSEPQQNSNGFRHESVISLGRQKFILPQRTGLPALSRYSQVVMPNGKRLTSGYTEASRGCKHLCRHCPIVPVYNGAFRVVAREIVLADIRQQVAAGAQHITFGDPDFFNGPSHAIAIVEQMHREFPALTFDATVKIEHLLKHEDLLGVLRDSGCLFITSAVESVDDEILARLDKGHTRADFLSVVGRFRKDGMVLQPTFVPFTPWTTLEGFCDLLDVLADHDLIANVTPIQLAIRLLIPAGSRLLELPDLTEFIGAFDSAALVYPWRHADPRVDALATEVARVVERGEKLGQTREQIFERIAEAAFAGAALPEARLGAIRAKVAPPSGLDVRVPARAVPHFDEPWYCCAEPSTEQLVCLKTGTASNARHLLGETRAADGFI